MDGVTAPKPPTMPSRWRAKPNYDKLLREFPNTLIQASDHFVGLPDGQMGNSEVGHLNIGAGRIVQMDITRIDAQIASGEFQKNPVDRAGYAARARWRAGSCISSAWSPMAACTRIRSISTRCFALRADTGWSAFLCTRSWMGATLRRTPAQDYIGKLEQKMREYGVGKVATVNGRYYAMDRDRRWERERKAFDAMVTGKAEGGAYTDPVARIKESYNNGVTDEFLVPFVVADRRWQASRPDSRRRRLHQFQFPRGPRAADHACAGPRERTEQEGRPRPAWLGSRLTRPFRAARFPRTSHYVCMTQYDKLYELPLVILPESMDNILANILSQDHLRNLRVAETEKFAHVTYFFNGGIEKPFPGEDRVLVPSLKVATYDLAPEMRAEAIGDAIVKAVNDTAFDLVVANFANADMVGHSGKLEPTIRAIEAVDAQLSRIYKAVKEKNGTGSSPRITATPR